MRTFVAAACLILCACLENEDLRCCCLPYPLRLSRMRIFVHAGCLILGFISRKWGHLLLLFALSNASCLKIRTFVAAEPRVSFETSFDLKHPKLKRIRNYHYPKQNACFCCFDSIPKQRVSIHSVIESIFCFIVFRFVLVCFERVCFRCFASIPKQRVSIFQLNQNKQKTKQNSLIESIFWYFSEDLGFFSVCFGLFRNSSVCFSCFNIGSKH
jgi:hypothetical protein